MPSHFIDHRQYDRRTLDLPVAFFSKEQGADQTRYAMGKTCDVSIKGARISAKPDKIPAIDSALILMLIPENEPSFWDADTTVRIRGKVIWSAPGNHEFGVKFT